MVKLFILNKNSYRKAYNLILSFIYLFVVVFFRNNIVSLKVGFSNMLKSKQKYLLQINQIL